jgi:hypothetical protein
VGIGQTSPQGVLGLHAFAELSTPTGSQTIDDQRSLRHVLGTTGKDDGRAALKLMEYFKIYC